MTRGRSGCPTVPSERVPAKDCGRPAGPVGGAAGAGAVPRPGRGDAGLALGTGGADADDGPGSGRDGEA
ncbi:hypothetical protein GCM10010398_20510 [Streptomyces fimbriatus]